MAARESEPCEPAELSDSMKLTSSRAFDRRLPVASMSGGPADEPELSEPAALAAAAAARAAAVVPLPPQPPAPPLLLQLESAPPPLADCECELGAIACNERDRSSTRRLASVYSA